MTYPTQVNETFPGASPGGVIEAVKRAMVLALREAVLDTTIQDDTSTVSSVDLEYPLKEEKYPGIWVQFSLSKLQRAGIAQELMNKNETDPDWINWEPIREWSFEGRVSLTIVALTSLERDRIADKLLSLLSFSRPPAGTITDPERDIVEYRALTSSLGENPYVSVSINSDILIPGGQSVSVGTPWAQNVLAYEDVYSFDVMGQFNIIFSNDGTYTLRRVDYVPEVWDIHDWH